LYKISCYFKEIGEVLEKVHYAGWVHLDISPNNVMFDPETEKVVLIDFGLSKRIGAQHQLGCGTSGYTICLEQASYTYI
jgi:serine/threonine protein kinase